MVETTKQVTLLRQHVKEALTDYFAQLDGQEPVNLYDMVLKEIETPLIKTALAYSNNNQTLAAKILGLSRGTLRKKLKYHKKET